MQIFLLCFLMIVAFFGGFGMGRSYQLRRDDEQRAHLWMLEQIRRHNRWPTPIAVDVLTPEEHDSLNHLEHRFEEIVEQDRKTNQWLRAEKQAAAQGNNGG